MKHLPKNLEISRKELEEYSMEDLSNIDDDVILDIVSDYLSDQFGFCHEGFENAEINSDKVVVTGILWDTSD